MISHNYLTMSLLISIFRYQISAGEDGEVNVELVDDEAEEQSPVLDGRDYNYTLTVQVCTRDGE